MWRETGTPPDITMPEKDFNPLPPCGGRPMCQRKSSDARYFNPLPPCGGRRRLIFCGVQWCKISIHSLRVEGDCLQSPQKGFTEIFQSTPSVWRETACNLRKRDFLRYFNPLPPCGGRLSEISERVKLTLISIHSLRVEGDGCYHGRRPRPLDFNPLPPCGGRP